MPVRFNVIRFLLVLVVLCRPLRGTANPEHSIARIWLEVLLQMVREDGQGPTIQARNFHHMSAAMYDAWAAYDPAYKTFFLGDSLGQTPIPFNPDFPVISDNIDSLRRIAISYAAFRVLYYRYNEYGSKGRTMDKLINKFTRLGFDESYSGSDYMSGKPEDLGNYIGLKITEGGMFDGSREEDNHISENYNPQNQNLRPDRTGVDGLSNPNRWQPIEIRPYIAKKGYDKTLKEWNYLLIDGNTIFLTAFWGEVVPFALTPKENPDMVYYDPGPPPLFNPNDSISTEDYRWGFQTVQKLSGAMSHDDPTTWDITPQGITSMDDHIPNTREAYRNYYRRVFENDWDHLRRNPVTKEPFEKNIVKRGDYCRVIAEFWVDGPNTASPPGHWLEFLIKASYHPDFERRWKGKGPALNQLEWDIRSYFLVCGAMHDVAITCWNIKSHYDYVRPISAIRYLGSLGQCSDPSKPNYNPSGLRLSPGSVELVDKNDPLVGDNEENLNKVKIYAWQGPDSITNPVSDISGTGWILAENWWPYQRYTFTTPPFAGYTSGHSTFSTAGAMLIHFITGSPYFPGGLETMTASKNKFLGFEDGPSSDVVLQWSTYYDAAVQTCLSRVWGGIHPPCDDIEGRRVGKKVAENAMAFSDRFFAK